MKAEFSRTHALLIALPHAGTDWAPYLGEISAAYERFILTAAEHAPVWLVHAPGANLSAYEGRANIRLLPYLTDDTWIRDYAPISVQQGFVGFRFNAWGGKFGCARDDAFKEFFAAQIAPVQPIDLVAEGGALETDGSTLLSTAECLLNGNRNGFSTREQAEEAFCSALGLDRLLLLENGAIIGDDTDAHIDTLARFLAPGVIAHAACRDASDEHYRPLSAMQRELAASGAQLVPLPIPQRITYRGRRLGCTYANFVICNDAIIMPTYADARADSYAAAALAEASGRAVRCVPAEVFVRQNGSLHCSCMNILSEV